MVSVFNYEDYRVFLRNALPVTGIKRGQRASLSHFIGVQPSFVSRVLKGEVSFSLEHVILIAEFLQMQPLEQEYLVLLVEKDKAGSERLKNYFKNKIEAIKVQMDSVKSRVNAENKLELEDQVKYYSSWIYGAIHMLSTISEFQDSESIQKRLGITREQTHKAIDFLVSSGLIKIEKGVLTSVTARVHLPKDSSLISKHHANWKLRSLQNIEKNKDEDLFFSGPITVSNKDAEKIRKMILDFISQLDQVIQNSPEEDLFCLGVDFYRV